MTSWKEVLIYFIILILLGVLSYTVYKLYQTNKEQLLLIETHKKECHTDSEIIFYDQAITSLKAQNKELYDSLQMYKKELDYVVRFNYKKIYVIDTVYVEKDPTIKEEIKEDTVNNVNIYEYVNEPNDSLQYKLSIGSPVKPIWYKIDLSVSDQFTLVNRRNDYNQNITTIQPSTNGTISDVTVWKKDNTSFWDNFSVGPTITAGYDVINDNLGIMVGLGVTWKIPTKK